MTLSHQFAQTLIGIALFYGIGLGLGPQYGLVGVLISSIAIFAAQIVFSRWWLKRYRYGPGGVAVAQSDLRKAAADAA